MSLQFRDFLVVQDYQSNQVILDFPNFLDFLDFQAVQQLLLCQQHRDFPLVLEVQCFQPDLENH